MKRDMDLVRYLLMTIEDAKGPLHLNDFTCTEWSTEEIKYHLALLGAHGLIDGNAVDAWGNMAIRVRVDGLSWDGADYLDAIRDERVFDRVKRAVKESTGSVTLDVFKSVASMLVLEAVKRQAGL